MYRKRGSDSEDSKKEREGVSRCEREGYRGIEGVCEIIDLTRHPDRE